MFCLCASGFSVDGEKREQAGLCGPSSLSSLTVSVFREAQTLKASLEEHDYASQDPAPSPQLARHIRRGPIPRICSSLQKKNLTSALNWLLEINGFKEALMKTCIKIISSEVSFSLSLRTVRYLLYCSSEIQSRTPTKCPDLDISFTVPPRSKL